MAIWVLFLFFFTLLALCFWHAKPERVFGSLLLLLLGSGAISSADLTAGMANSGLTTLVLLMLACVALEKTLLFSKLSGWMFDRSYSHSWWRVMLSSAGISALVNNTAVVSMLLEPVRTNQYHPLGRFLWPMTIMVSLGGMLTLVGTSTNLIVNTFITEAGLTPFSILDFFPVAIAGLLLVLPVLWWRTRHLPELPLNRDDLSGYLLEARIRANSPLCGKSVARAGLRNLYCLYLIEILRDDQQIFPVTPSTLLEAGDVLLFSGDADALHSLNASFGLDTYALRQGFSANELTEVLITPTSSLCGTTLKGSDFRSRFNAAVVAMRRDRHAISGALGQQILQPGDYLLLATGADFWHHPNLRRNFVFILGSKLTPILSPGIEKAISGGFILTILLSALGIVDLLLGMIFYLGGLLFCGALSADDLRRRFPLQIWIVILSALCLSKAIDNSGLIHELSTWVILHGQKFPPYWMMVGLFLFTWLITEVITNNATAALMTPVALAIAKGMAVSPLPFLMAVAYASSCSFVSPYGYQTNLMAFNAGGYALKDVVCFGLFIAPVYFLSVLIFIPLFFPF